MVFIVRKKLSAAETQPSGLRYDGDCECVQQFVNDDWVDNPAADPRTSPAYQYPPPDTADPACDAGARISAAVGRIIDTMVTGAGVLEAVNAILATIALFFPPIALFVALLFALVNAANAIGFAAVALAFTPEVYDDLKCIVACYIGSDGQFDATEWDDFQAAIGAHFGLSTVTVMLSLMFNGMGIVGFNNMAAVGTETGDCDACDECFETCHLYDPMVVDVDYINSNDGVTLFGTYDTGFFDDGKTLVLTRVQATWTQTGGSGSVVAGGLHVTVYSADVYPTGHTFTANDTSASASADIDTTGSGHVTRIIAQIFTQWSGGGPYSTYDTLQLDYEPVHSPFGWASGVDCTP